MTAYTIIPNTSIDAGSLTDEALVTALRDNPLAIAEGDVTAPVIAKVGPNCTGGTQTVGDNSTKLATTAYCENFVNNDVGFNAVGSLALATYSTVNTAITAGSTYAGSSLNYAGFRHDMTSGGGVFFNGGIGTLSGTWRALGGCSASAGVYSCTLLQRIS